MGTATAGAAAYTAPAAAEIEAFDPDDAAAR